MSTMSEDLGVESFIVLLNKPLINQKQFPTYHIYLLYLCILKPM